MFFICNRLHFTGSCEVRGDPHITTTDGKRYSYHGACTYQLVHDLSRTLFIYGDFFKCGRRRQVSCLAKTTILYEGHNITLEREQIIHVNGVVIPISSLHFFTNDNHVQIDLVGGWIKVELSCGVYLKWDQVKWIDIYLPITFQGRTIGKLGRRRQTSIFLGVAA